LRADLAEAQAEGDRAAVLSIVRRILAVMTPGERRAAAARLELARQRPC